MLHTLGIGTKAGKEIKEVLRWSKVGMEVLTSGIDTKAEKNYRVLGDSQVRYRHKSWNGNLIKVWNKTNLEALLQVRCFIKRNLGKYFSIIIRRITYTAYIRNKVKHLSLTNYTCHV